MRFQPGQTSLINWLKLTNRHEKVLIDSIRYDNEKTKRLEKLHNLTDLPINTTHYLNGEEFALSSKKIQLIIQKRGGLVKRHAFRIAPKEKHAGAFPVIKKYGVTFAEFAKYLSSLPIDPRQTLIRITDYRAKIRYSTIVISGKDGIVGEVADGTLYALTYGQKLHSGQKLAPFYLEYGKKLQILSTKKSLQRLAERVLKFLYVKTPALKKKLSQANFPLHQNYLGGYYEYIEGDNGDAAFTDMNCKQITNNIHLASSIKFLKQLKQFSVQPSVNIRGLVANPSATKITGTVQIINDPEHARFKTGNILACATTDIRYLPLMRRAKAVITDQGGITSHPAIIARELNLPCIVSTKIATRKLRNGERIEMNTDTGIIRKIN